MKKIALIFSLVLFIQACSPTRYTVRTQFYLLNRGMSKQAFMTWQGMNKQTREKPAVGTYPISSKTFKHGNDLWEVWVFQVYDCSNSYLGCLKDHKEHVAFKNGYLEEWGTGTLPITIRQNPNQFKYDININK